MGRHGKNWLIRRHHWGWRRHLVWHDLLVRHDRRRLEGHIFIF
jgi:hypothetical protein